MALLKQYSALLRFLKSGKGKLLENSFDAEPRIGATRQLPTLGEEELRRASLDDIAKWVSDEATPRKDLEFIAIQRFSVPRGSMRSFSNKGMLIELPRPALFTIASAENYCQFIREKAVLSM